MDPDPLTVTLSISVPDDTDADDRALVEEALRGKLGIDDHEPERDYGFAIRLTWSR